MYIGILKYAYYWFLGSYSDDGNAKAAFEIEQLEPWNESFISTLLASYTHGVQEA